VYQACAIATYRRMSPDQNLSWRSIPATIKTYLPLKPNLESIALDAPEIVRAGFREFTRSSMPMERVPCAFGAMSRKSSAGNASGHLSRNIHRRRR
jgi:hypothetical protein